MPGSALATVVSLVVTKVCSDEMASLIAWPIAVTGATSPVRTV